MRNTFTIAFYCLAALALLTTYRAEAAYTFDRYQVILDRKPFGDEPPPEPEPVAKIIPPEQSFARNIRMSAIWETDDGDISKVGIVDKQTNKSYTLGIGEAEDGIELVSASYEEQEAVLRKGDEMAIIQLQSGEIKALNAEEQTARLKKSTTRRPSYAERRRARMARRNEPPPEPKFKGEELKKHLQEYQMEVIRQGLPPLPIQLTPEMDDQLVQEGILPPAE